MKKIKKLCIFSDGYPSKNNPVYVFVEQLVRAISNQGVQCVVITSRHHYWQKRKNVDYDDRGNPIVIHRSYSPKLGAKKVFGKALSYYVRDISFRKAFQKNALDADAIYAHFWNAGMAAAQIDSGLPLFVASGESRVWVQDLYSRKIIQRQLNKFTGVICVSGKNQEESVELGLIDRENTVVIPNAIDNSVFYKREKEECRKQLGFPKDAFIVAFVGAFIDRKGPLRVAEAITKIDDDVKSVFIGKGEQHPDCDGILFCGRLPHDDIPVYLNAADVFVLPTKQEGCCNAIVEAMACGLPIISSNRSFNDDILNKNNSIRIDSEDVNQIAQAIASLKDSPELRYRMEQESLKLAEDHRIEKRARKIIEFMESKM